jgi:hypothetical protein
MPWWEMLVAIAGGISIVFGVWKLFFEKMSKMIKNSEWLTNAPQKYNLIINDIKTINLRVDKLETCIERIKENSDIDRISFKNNFDEMKDSIRLIEKGVSALLESSIHDGNCKNQLMEVKKEFDQAKHII